MSAEEPDPVFTCVCEYFRMARTEELNEAS